MADDHIARNAQALAQYALARLDLVEMAFAALPGVDAVDLAAIRREAGERWARRAPYLSQTERDAVLDEAVARMTRGTAAPERD